MNSPFAPSRPDANISRSIGCPSWRGFLSTLRVMSICAGVFAASSAQAVLLVYDGFGVGPGGYTADANIDGQGHGTGWALGANWTDDSAGTEFITPSGSNVPASVQNQDGVLVRASTATTYNLGREYSTTFGGTTPSISEAWFSFGFTRSNNTRNFTINPIAEDIEGDVGQYFGISGSNGTSVLSARIRWGTSAQVAIAAETVSVTLGTNYFVIGQVLFNESGVEDVFNVWVIPSESYTEGPLGAPDMTVSFDFSETFTHWAINSGNPNGQADGLTLDEFRIGTTLADVTPIPEPSGALLVGVAGLALLLGGRRKVRRD